MRRAAFCSDWDFEEALLGGREALLGGCEALLGGREALLGGCKAAQSVGSADRSMGDVASVARLVGWLYRFVELGGIR